MEDRNIVGTLGAWRAGHNPDGRQKPKESELTPELMRRMMRGEISAAEATKQAQDSAASRRRFNDRIRREALGVPGGEVSAEKFLATETRPGDSEPPEAA